MKKLGIFCGVGTALITPFKDGKIDFVALRELIERQIRAKIDALVIGGTTAEAATLSDTERYELFEYARDVIGGRCRLIYGTGTNDTRVAIKHTEYASHLGCDGVLVVTPYYNRGTAEGVIRHYEAIAKASGVPVLLYNVPSRTGVNLSLETLERLAENDMIVGIKEASGNISQVAEIAALAGDKIDIYSGNDDQIVPILSLGGKGVISVLSNVMPKETSDMCKMYFDGDVNGSLKLQLKLLPLVNALFSEVNPIPVKAAVSAMGYGENYLRLPLTPMEDATRAVLYKEMKNVGINI